MANIIEIILIILIREMDQIVRVHQYSRSSIVALFVVKAAMMMQKLSSDIISCWQTKPCSRNRPVSRGATKCFPKLVEGYSEFFSGDSSILANQGVRYSGYDFNMMMLMVVAKCYLTTMLKNDDDDDDGDGDEDHKTKGSSLAGVCD